MTSTAIIIENCCMTTHSLPLLMTASVSTRGMKGARYTDEERERMYVEALTFYIHHLLRADPQQVIVFVENSGWDLQRIQRLLPPFDHARLDFISLPPDAFDVSQGKGYNELLLINMAVECSAFIWEAGAFFKVTGRYPIFNLALFIAEAAEAINRGAVWYCDVKDHRFLTGFIWAGVDIPLMPDCLA